MSDASLSVIVSDECSLEFNGIKQDTLTTTYSAEEDGIYLVIQVIDGNVCHIDNSTLTASSEGATTLTTKNSVCRITQYDILKGETITLTSYARTTTSYLEIRNYIIH